MENMEKKVLMQLLDKLISSMDDYEAGMLDSKDEGMGEIDSGEPVAVVEEKSVMPVEEVPDMLEEKLGEIEGESEMLMPSMEKGDDMKKRMLGRGQFAKSLKGC
jgi:hypothetical protein